MKLFGIFYFSKFISCNIWFRISGTKRIFSFWMILKVRKINFTDKRKFITNTHTHTHTQTHTRHIRIYIYYIYIYIYIYIYSYVYIHVYINTYPQKYSYIHIHTHIYPSSILYVHCTRKFDKIKKRKIKYTRRSFVLFSVIFVVHWQT